MSTKAGIKAARARGKLPGNPGLRARDPAAIRKAAAARASSVKNLLDQAEKLGLAPPATNRWG